MRECAKTLDSLGIPPCGHRARENGILIKVYASCQQNEEAAEPCFSMEAVRAEDDGSVTHYIGRLTQQRSVWFDSTKLVCCNGPDFPCPQTTFQHLKWEDAVDRSVCIHRVKRKESGRNVWYYIMLHRAGESYQETFKLQLTKNRTLRLSDWGHVLESGEGKNVPKEIKDKVNNWTTVAN